MKVFISWSGPQSKAVAFALRRWLKDVFHIVDPWMSAVDIYAGARWSTEVSQHLEASKFGIICLTKENQARPWIMFEAGALAKTVNNTFVVPYLIGLTTGEILPGPLTEFQAKEADQDGTWDVLISINDALKDSKVSQEDLRRYFDRWWPDLKQTLDNLPSEAIEASPNRPSEEIMEEILDLTRGISRQIASQETARMYSDESPRVSTEALSPTWRNSVSVNPEVLRKFAEALLNTGKSEQISAELGLATLRGSRPRSQEVSLDPQSKKEGDDDIVER